MQQIIFKHHVSKCFYYYSPSNGIVYLRVTPLKTNYQWFHSSIETGQC